MTSVFRALAVLLVVALLATACGSTVRGTVVDGAAAAGMVDEGSAGASGGVGGPGASSTAAPLASGGGLGTTPAGSPAGGTTAAGPSTTSGAPATSSGGPAGTGGPAGPGTGPGEGTGTAEAPPSTTPGVGAASGGPAAGEPILVGIPFLDGASAALTAGLGTEVSFGDGQLQAEALIDDLNARGGINGRPLEAVFAGIESNSTDQETEFAAACSAFTEDHQVFAVLNTINPPESFISCVAEKATPMFNVSFSSGDEVLYERYGDYFFSPPLLNLDAQARLMLDTLQAEGTFDDPLTKVGLLVYDGDPQTLRVAERTIIPRLEALGVPYEAAMTALGGESATELRFAATGVNLVLFSSPSGIQQLLFMNAAGSQGYTPRYMLSDADSARFVSENAPPAQAANIRGVGTFPLANVPLQSYPTTPLEQRCLDVIRAGGEDNASRMTNLTATVFCEIIWMFETVAGAAGPDLTHASLVAAYRSLGTSYQPLVTFSTDFSNGVNDNASIYRTFAWDGDCRCLGYSSGDLAIPR